MGILDFFRRKKESEQSKPSEHPGYTITIPVSVYIAYYHFCQSVIQLAPYIDRYQHLCWFFIYKESAFALNKIKM